MIDADSARIAKHLAGIDLSLKQLVRVMETLNKNFVTMVEALKDVDDASVDSGQLTLEDQGSENDR